MRERWPILWLCLVYIYGTTILAQSNDSLAQIAHVVEAGETLTAIAANYGVTVDEIAASNDLDPEAILRIGQRLVIEFNTGAGAPPLATPAALEQATLEQTTLQEQANALPSGETRAIGGTALDNDLPPAPVAAADAPKLDPAASDALVCVSLYADDNQNSARDPGERSVSDGLIRLLNEHGELLAERRADAESQPLCLGDGQPRVYIVAVAAPAGYGLTSSGTLRVDLRDGLPLDLAFGVAFGLESEATSDAASGEISGLNAEIDMQNSSPVRRPPTGVPASDLSAGDSLLYELSGLFALALAGMVLLCGGLVSLFLRFR